LSHPLGIPITVILVFIRNEEEIVPERIVVLKFGSSVLRSHADLPSVVHEIYRWYRDGTRVIAVVSAIGDATERLIRQSRELCATLEPWATAELLATGERTAAALLGIALDRAGIPARVVNPREIGLEVRDNRSTASHSRSTPSTCKNSWPNIRYSSFPDSLARTRPGAPRSSGAAART